MPPSRSRRSLAASWCRSIPLPPRRCPASSASSSSKKRSRSSPTPTGRRARRWPRSKPQFDDAGHGAVSSATIFAAFDKALGAPPDMPSGAATVVKADYRVPFLPHATMEPMACTAKVDGDRAEVWAGTQDPLNSRSTAAKALGISADRRPVHEPCARRRLRTEAPRISRLRRHRRARIAQGDVTGAGED